MTHIRSIHTRTYLNEYALDYFVLVDDLVTQTTMPTHYKGLPSLMSRSSRFPLSQKPETFRIFDQLQCWLFKMIGWVNNL